MGKLHELLAVEQGLLGSTEAMYKDTADKFSKPDNYFTSEDKSLEMLEDSLANKALEKQHSTSRALKTTVPATLDWFFQQWVRTEDVLFQKNVSNTLAFANVVVAEDNFTLESVPVDELMGLEARLSRIKKLVLDAPTLDAGKKWVRDPQAGRHVWVAPDVHTAKTEKKTYPVELSPATKEHKAQVIQESKDVVVGTFTTTTRSGCISAVQKSEVLLRVDRLLGAVKQARQRANAVDASTRTIGALVSGYLMAGLDVLE